MKYFIAVFLLLAFIYSPAYAASEKVSLSADDLKIVDAYIKSKERTSDIVGESVSEFYKARQYMIGDVNGDKVPDVIVMYTLEQGMNWNIYIAVFEKPSMRLLADGHVGGKGDRKANLNKVLSNGLIEVSVMLYAPEDAYCCPSLKGTSYYAVEKNVLIEKSSATDYTERTRPKDPSKQ